MKLIKKYAGLLLMLTLLVGFTSCEDDEDLEERMFGRVWVGDVGMSAGNGQTVLVKSISFFVIESYTTISAFSGIGKIAIAIT